MGGGSVRNFVKDIGLGSIAEEADRASGKKDKDKAVAAEAEANRIQAEADKKRAKEKENQAAVEAAEDSRDSALRRQKSRANKSKGRSSTLLGGMNSGDGGAMGGGKSLLGM